MCYITKFRLIQKPISNYTPPTVHGSRRRSSSLTCSTRFSALARKVPVPVSDRVTDNLPQTLLGSTLVSFRVYEGHVKIHNLPTSPFSSTTRHQFKPSSALYEPLNICFRDHAGAHRPYQSTVLLISATVPEYRGTAAGVRTLGVIRHLQNLGFRVVLATTGKVHQAIADYCAEYAALDVDIVRVAANDGAFQDFVSSLMNGRYYQRFHPSRFHGNANEVQSSRATDTDVDSMTVPPYPHLPLSMVLFDRFPLEEQFSWRVREVAPTVVTVVDTQDIYALRYTREKALAMAVDDQTPTQLPSVHTSSLHPALSHTPTADTTNIPTDTATTTFTSAALRLDAADNTVLRELAALHRADASLLVSEEEARLCASVGLQMGRPGTRDGAEGQVGKMWYIPITFPKERRSECDSHLDKDASSDVSASGTAPQEHVTPSFEQRKHYVTIGTWRHPPNVDSVKFLKTTIFPKIREKFRKLGFPEHAIPELHAYGSHATAEHMGLHSEDEGVKVLGTAPTVEGTLTKYRVMLVS